MGHRIESRPGWHSAVSALKNWDIERRSQWRDIIASQAFSELSRRNYDTAALNAASPLGDLAEAADDAYLEALEESDGAETEKVMDLFAIARSLAALVYVNSGFAPDELLDATYELVVISDTLEADLLHRMSAGIGD